MKKVALVTGANRGLGFETCRQLGKKGFQIILSSRQRENGIAATAKLAREGIDVEFIQLDVTDRGSIEKARDWIWEKYGRLDVLVNNAGIMLDPMENASASALDMNVDILRRTFETNVSGPYQMCQVFIPLMKKNGYGRVVNVSSGMGQLSEMNGGYPGYRVSKTALNALTRIFADETTGSGILVNSICPGWVKTDMGGPQAELSVEEGVQTIVWAATLPEGGPTGGFFREKEAIAW